jgi:hypothetical protein
MKRHEDQTLIGPRPEPIRSSPKTRSCTVNGFKVTIHTGPGGQSSDAQEAQDKEILNTLHLIKAAPLMQELIANIIGLSTQIDRILTEARHEQHQNQS